jgi:hypothetical protein
LETDPTLMVLTFNNSKIVDAWNIRNRWRNGILFFKQMNEIVSQIYREANQVVDSIPNYGCNLAPFNFWQVAHDFVKDIV